ncbi:MAG: hypothetical protein ABI906_06710 [Pseudomonadota bacterium]
MVIVDFERPGGAIERVAAVGSCRLLAPMAEAIRAHDGRVVCHAGAGYTHSASEAAQHIAFCRRQLDVPVYFSPYIFDRDAMPVIREKTPGIIESAQTFIVEISTREDLICDKYSFNSLALIRRLVQRKGATLLSWFRQLSRDPPTIEMLDMAVNSLVLAGTDVDTPVRRVLEETRRISLNPQEFARDVANIIFDPAKRWIFLPNFDVSEIFYEQFPGRAELRDMLLGEVSKRGYEIFDPTPVVLREGRANALDGPYHYTREFVSVMGEAIFQAILANGAVRPVP